MEVGEELASRERWTRVMDAGKRMAHLRAGKTLHSMPDPSLYLHYA